MQVLQALNETSTNGVDNSGESLRRARSTLMKPIGLGHDSALAVLWDESDFKGQGRQ